MPAATSASAITYSRRRPENSALHRVVQDNWLTFQALHDAEGHPLPKHVVAEFEGYLACGILARGFARVHCGNCGHDRLVAFSCKLRGFCSSCIGRRMASTAVHLVDNLLPNVPMRQWVITVPQPLRSMLSYDTALCAVVMNEPIRSVFAWLKRKAKSDCGLTSVSRAYPGAITAVQRFNSACQLSIHGDVLVTDGVFAPSPMDTNDGTAVTFYATPAPTDAETAQIAWTTCQRVVAYLRKQGRFVDGDSGDSTIADDFAANEPALAACYAGSITGTITLGPNAGRRVVRLFGQAAGARTRKQKPAHGFDVHAATHVAANDKAGRERLKLLHDGRVQLKLETPWSDGTSKMVFEALDFMGKLAAQVPPPRAHLVKYSGVFAPNHKLRKLVVPKRVELPPTESCESHGAAPVTPPNRARRLSWAQLMKRVFEVVAKILRSVGLSTEAPKLAPARRGAQVEFSF